MQYLSDLLQVARDRLFVGREEECQLFEEALTHTPLPFHILYIWGPGGIGKSTLLSQFCTLCGMHDVPCFYLDAHNLEPSAASLQEALTREVRHRGGDATSLADVAEHAKRVVLIIDTYEVLMPLDGWICENFIPRLPANALLVLASRQSRPDRWRSHMGLQSLTHTLSIRNLTSVESRRLLTLRNVPPEQHEAVVHFSRGYPLALALIADAFDQQPELTFAPERTPDVLTTLLRRFLSAALTATKRQALIVSALVRYTTEPLFDAVCDGNEAHSLFEWIRQLSFVEASASGLVVHNLVREVVVADARWRDEAAYQALHSRIRRFYTEQLTQSTAAEYKRILADYLFVSRYNPVIQPVVKQLRAQGDIAGLRVEPYADAADVEVLRAAIARHEGNDSAELFDAWIRYAPDGLVVVYDQQNVPQGGLFTFAFDNTLDLPQPLADDPALKAVTHYLAQHTALRPQEYAVLFRFWFSCTEYQAISPVQSLLFVQTVKHYLRTPKLAFSFLPCAHPGFWHPIMAFADVERLTDVSFASEKQSYGLFGHDWRLRPPARWLDLLAQRGQAFTPSEQPTAPLYEHIVLNEQDFAAAVKDALQLFTQVDLLQDNPLLRSHLVQVAAQEKGDYGVRARSLQDRILDVASTLQASPREAKFYRALDVTYFDPAPTQERAAEQLDLPFSTYRRHLRQGVDYLIQALWKRELHG